MKTVFVLRHGNTFDPGETVRRVGRGTDLPLSASGRMQAEALARELSDRVAHVISSPLRRTRETAEALGRNVAFDDRLLEIDYGPDEGKPEAEVVARLGEAAIAAWDDHATVPPGWLVAPEAIRADWRALLDEVPDHTAIVTSNGIARFLLDVADHGGAPRKLRTGAYGVIEETDAGWRIARWNVRPAAPSGRV